MQELFSVKESSARLGLSSWTLRSWVRCGRIEYIRIGRRILIRGETIQALIDRGRRSPLSLRLRRLREHGGKKKEKPVISR